MPKARASFRTPTKHFQSRYWPRPQSAGAAAHSTRRPVDIKGPHTRDVRDNRRRAPLTRAAGGSRKAGAAPARPHSGSMRSPDRAPGSCRGIRCRCRSLGSFEEWGSWCRNPLLALGCRDPVERIEMVKADDPQRRRIVELFETWEAYHGERPIKAADLAQQVRALTDPQGRGRQFTAACLIQLTGTRAGGFVLTRQAAAGKWGAATYALCRAGSPLIEPRGRARHIRAAARMIQLLGP